MELNFNAQNVDPASADFEMIPAGWYVSMIEKAELKPTKAGDGSYIALMVKILGAVGTGEHEGRYVFGNLNYQNPNTQAQEIGQRQLSALCHAINVMNLTSVEQLQGVQFEMRVKQGKPTYNVKGDPSSGIEYEARNEIQGFRAVGSEEGGSNVAQASGGPAKPVSKPTTAQQAEPEAQQAEQAQQAQTGTGTAAQPW